MTSDVASADEWPYEITAEARRSGQRVVCALPRYMRPPYENTAQFWALLVFRTMYKGIV
ncbi:hypothetical protein [Streptomyces sp. NPDC005548]|uniref:hypothetical protein n=1 Tax=Streptomyces sp. NPDC005548 TaxID=3364724 RepID=UPI0036C74112